ncbi:MAG: Cysteine desulfurase [Parcubacteria group bacterium GW2011_GWD2_42_14]|nr:MAG: Cysteine desulfurase [Parcubacteria group bacterium GW2011_GWD2_42_14]
MNTTQRNEQTRIYLDNGASTAVDSRVVAVMQPYWSEHIGNAGSLHAEGRYAKNILDEARSSVAKSLHAIGEQVIFTSGGTESNNLAIFGVIEKCLEQGKKPEELHIITSAVEHNSITDCYAHFERKGVQVTYIPVDTEGRVDVQKFESAFTENTVLVSCMYVNNEIGTIEHIKELSGIVRQVRKNNSAVYPLFHTDASQSPAWVTVNIQKLGVDLLTLDSQKIYGPKGAGCLFVRDREHISPMMFGGGQEYGLRPGTPPIPLIVGFAKALELVEEERETYVKEVAELRDWLIAYILKNVDNVVLNGAFGEGRIAGNINISFPNIDDEQLVIEMDVRGVAVSAKSACLSGIEGSRVVKALHNGSPKNSGALRFSLSRYTTKSEIERCAQWLQTSH